MKRVSIAAVAAAALVGGALAPRGSAGDPPAPPPVAASPCAGAEHRQFDFWLGRWTVYSAKGGAVGRSEITSILGGCVIHEHWRGLADPPKYEGESFSLFDARHHAWRQTWVDTAGVTARVDGTLEGGRMVLAGEAGSGPPGNRVRMSWTPATDGSVVQRIENSLDQGATWTLAAELTYRRSD